MCAAPPPAPGVAFLFIVHDSVFFYRLHLQTGLQCTSAHRTVLLLPPPARARPGSMPGSGRTAVRTAREEVRFSHLFAFARVSSAPQIAVIGS